MKINEVEKLLGITKANIRFYEKEGLLTPHRTANGYRDYEDSDILLLKQIIILRKLGFPTAQISDILNGALPLQDALEEHIASHFGAFDRVIHEVVSPDIHVDLAVIEPTETYFVERTIIKNKAMSTKKTTGDRQQMPVAAERTPFPPRKPKKQGKACPMTQKRSARLPPYR